MEKDHRNIVRFPNRKDSALSKLVSRLERCINDSGPWRNNVWRLRPEEKTRLLHDWLGTRAAPEEDLLFFSEKSMPGTCDWIKSDPEFRGWLSDASSHPKFLWYHGLPGCGKSVLASQIVQHIQHLRKPCQYFFFREEDPSNSSVVSLIKCLAVQFAAHSTQFYNHIVGLACRAESLDHVTAQMLWRKFFVDGIAKPENACESPIYWVIDGLDICSVNASNMGFEELSLSSFPLRILVLSRWTQIISTTLCQLETTVVDLDTVPAKQHALALFVETKIGRSHPLFGQILEDAQGNLQWASIVIDNLLDCYGEFSIADATREAEVTFVSLWEDVASKVFSQWRGDEPFVAKDFLTWVLYARSPLTVKQVCEALECQVPTRFNPKDIPRLCEAFVMVDKLSFIRFRHRSARTFLLDAKGHGLCPAPPSGQKMLLKVCLGTILKANADQKDVVPGDDSFLNYAITSWDYHLRASVEEVDRDTLESIEQLLTGSALVRLIQFLATLDQLSLMVSAATALHALRLSSPTALRKYNINGVLESGAVELTRIFGKFGGQLRRHPSAIYDVVPPFCPKSSYVRTQYLLRRHRHRPFWIDVRGTLPKTWDDTLARLTAPRPPSEVLCTSRCIAISSASIGGYVTIVSASTLSAIKTISHGEVIRMMRFSNSGNMLATYGYRTIKVWQIDTSLSPWIFEAPPMVQILDMAFQQDDMAILACGGDGDIWKFPLLESTKSGRIFDSLLVETDSGLLQPPDCAAFNPGTTQIAASFGGLRVSTWKISPGGLFGQTDKPEEDLGKEPQAGIRNIHWTSDSEIIILVRKNGSAWTWYPRLRVENLFIRFGVALISTSLTRPLLLSSDEQGRLEIWDTDGLSLIHSKDFGEKMRGLALCPNGKRIYVLREGSCDVWEPDRLFRLAMGDDLFTTATVDTAPSVEDWPCQPNVSSIPIGGLAVSSRSFMHCSAHSGGDLKVFDSTGNLVYALEASYTNTVTQMAWSSNETYLAVSDVSYKVRIFDIRLEDSPGNHHHPHLQQQQRRRQQHQQQENQGGQIVIAEVKLREPIDQLLFSEDDGSLLIVSEHSIRTWRFRERSEPEACSNISGPCHWSNHPLEPGSLLRISLGTIDVLDWQDLRRLYSFEIQIPDASGVFVGTVDALRSRRVIKTYPSQDHSRILIHTSPLGTSRDFDLLSIRIADLQTTPDEGPVRIKATKYPQQLLSRVRRTLGLIDGSKYGITTGISPILLAFIDQNGWICSCSEEGILREHFFLPLDWLDSDSLDLAQLGKDGTLFLPKDGAVGVITNGFRNVLSQEDHDNLQSI